MRVPDVRFVDVGEPSHSNDAAFVRWMGRYKRHSATAADVARQMQSIRELDAAEQLAEISAPTLIVMRQKTLLSPSLLVDTSSNGSQTHG